MKKMFIEYGILTLCLLISLTGLYLGLDAHYTEDCRSHGFSRSAITLQGVACREAAQTVFLRDLTGKFYIFPEESESVNF